MFDWIRRAAQNVGNFVYNSTPVGGAIKTVNRSFNRRDPREQQYIQQRQAPPPRQQINLPKVNLNQASNILRQISTPGLTQLGNFVTPVQRSFDKLTQPQVRGVKDFVKPPEQRIKPLSFEATVRDINTGQVVPKPPRVGVKAGIEPKASLVGKLAMPVNKKSPLDNFLSGLNMAFRQTTGQRLTPEQEAILRRSPQANAFLKLAPRPAETANAIARTNPVWNTARSVQNGEIFRNPAETLVRNNNPFQGLADLNARIQRDISNDPYIRNASQQGFNRKVLELNKRASDNSKQFISDQLNKVLIQGGANLPGIKQVRQTTPGKFVGENIVDPMLQFYIDTAARVGGTGTGQRGAYNEGFRGLAELGTDITNVGSLAYTGAKAAQLAASPLKQALRLAPNVFARQVAANSGANVLNQLAEGKKLNQIDPIQVAGAGLLGGALGTGIPLGGKVLGKGISKVLGKGTAKAAQNLDAPITVKTWAEKGKLLQDGYTNVKVKFSSPTHSVDIKNNGVVTELAPKGIKGVKIDKATQEAVDAGALSPKLAQQGYKVTPDLEIISPQGKKLSIGEIQQLEQASALTKAEQKIAQGTETLDQAEDLTKKLGRQVYADTAPQPRTPIGRFDRKPINPELEQLKAYQAEQIQQLQRVRPNSPEARGIKNNYDAAQKRIDALEPQPIYETVPKGTFDEGAKTRGFSETLQQSAPTNPLNPLGSKQFIDDIPGYKPITNKATFTKATKDIETRGVDTVYDELLSKQTLDVVDNAKAQLLLNRFVETDDLTRATALAQKTASDATSAGQAIQVLSAYNKLTPGGAFRDLQSRVNKYNEANKNKPITISPEVQKELQKLTTKLQGLKEGTRDWQVTAALIEKTKADVMPVTTLTKVSALQNFALLMNPKTLIRNILGNGVLDVLEDTSRLTAAGLDKALNTLGLTKQRNVVVPSFSKNWLNKATGFKYGVEDVKLGISTKGTTSKFDLKPDTFKNPLLHKVEQALGVELSAFDRAFYEGRYNSSLDNITKAWKLKAPNKAAKEVAEAEALYATFQNNSKLAEGLSKTKRALNAGKDWGLGDLVLKYPKTPGNIVSVGMDYSPIGFAKGLKQFYDSVKQQSPVKQREAILNLSRGITGSGLILGGAFLAKQGIITGNPESDPDIRALKRDAGEAPFSFNLSALGRLLSGQSTEVRDGDITMNYDWLQPNAIQLSMGANMIINRKDATEGLNSTFETLAGGIETITNQPVLTGIQRFVSAMDSSRGGGLGKAFQQLAVNTPSSFVPSILNQVGQLTDSTMRNTYAPDFKQETLNKVIARIPGLRNTLQPRIDQYGRTVTANNLVGGNNAFNVFLNPAFIRKVNISPENRLVFDIFQRSGETQQAPRVAPEKITINGQQYAVTPEEYTKYQQYIGSKTQVAFSRLAQDPRFLALNDTDKALYMNRILTDINSAAKVELFGNQPKTLTSGTKEVLGGRDLGYETAEEKRARTARPKKVKIKKGRTARARKGRKLAIAKSKQPKLRSIRISAGKVPKISRTAKVKFRRYA